MESELISALDIIKQGLLTEDSLVALAAQGKIKVRNLYGELVDIDELKKQAEELQRLCSEEITVDGRRYCRVRAWPDEIPSQGGISKTEHIPPAALYKRLAGSDIPRGGSKCINIARSQYYEILEGWTDEKFRKVILGAYFRQEDLVTTPSPLSPAPAAPPQDQPPAAARPQGQEGLDTEQEYLKDKAEILAFFGVKDLKMVKIWAEDAGFPLEYPSGPNRPPRLSLLNAAKIQLARKKIG